MLFGVCRYSMLLFMSNQTAIKKIIELIKTNRIQETIVSISIYRYRYTVYICVCLWIYMGYKWVISKWWKPFFSFNTADFLSYKHDFQTNWIITFMQSLLRGPSIWIFLLYSPRGCSDIKQVRYAGHCKPFCYFTGSISGKIIGSFIFLCFCVTLHMIAWRSKDCALLWDNSVIYKKKKNSTFIIWYQNSFFSLVSRKIDWAFCLVYQTQWFSTGLKQSPVL